MNRFGAVLVAAALVGAANAQMRTFTVVGERLQMRNVAQVESETEFETFTGRTSNVTGAIQFDPAKKSGSGRIVVDVKSIDTGIPLRNEHMMSPQWLNAEKHPTITFETTQVQNTGGDNYRVVGRLTMNGVTKVVSAQTRVRYRAFNEQVQQAGFGGDLLHLTTSFTVKLSDFGVSIPAPAKGKVSNEVKITLNAYAVARRG